jgi:hypothetical protein
MTDGDPKKLAAEVYDQLANFELKGRDTVELEYDAFKVGTRDDVVTALGLAWFVGQDSIKYYVHSVCPIEILRSEAQHSAFRSIMRNAENENWMPFRTKKWHLGL